MAFRRLLPKLGRFSLRRATSSKLFTSSRRFFASPSAAEIKSNVDASRKLEWFERKDSVNVTVVGAAGGIGQPLSMLLHQNAKIGKLNLYDVAPVVAGVAADVSHMPFQGQVNGFSGDQLEESLEGADIVVIPAGVPRKPGMTRDDLFNTNATIVANIAKAVGAAAPDAFSLIISNPVNSTVPIFAKVLEGAGVYNPQKVMGVTHLDVFRATRFLSEKINSHISDVNVIGGHAGKTIVPVFSYFKNSIKEFSGEEIDALAHRVAFGGDEVVQAKDGAGSATLSMAAAASEFTGRLVKTLTGGYRQTACAFVETDAFVSDCQFSAGPVSLTPAGWEVSYFWEAHELSSREQAAVDDMRPDLQSQIQKGLEFAAGVAPAPAAKKAAPKKKKAAAKKKKAKK